MTKNELADDRLNVSMDVRRYYDQSPIHRPAIRALHAIEQALADGGHRKLSNAQRAAVERALWIISQEA